jgi:hypothetical protein
MIEDGDLDVLDQLEDLFDDLSFDEPTKDQLFKMYGVYLNDLIKNELKLNGKKILYNSNKSNHPICKGKHQCFEHIITRESKYNGKRTFDKHRANKIHWIKPILEQVSDKRIKYFEGINYKGENQIFLWYKVKDYLIILKELRPDLLLITSFSIDKYNKNKYQKLYENYTTNQK